MVFRLPAARRPHPLHLVMLVLLAHPTTAAEQELALGVLHINDEYPVLAERQHAKASRIIYGREQLAKSSDTTVGDYLRKLPGVNRPAIACLWPSHNPGGFNLMLDVGADVKAEAEDLLQYAINKLFHRVR